MREKGFLMIRMPVLNIIILFQLVPSLNLPIPLLICTMVSITCSWENTKMPSFTSAISIQGL